MKQGLFVVFCLCITSLIVTNLVNQALSDSNIVASEVVMIKDGEQIFSSNLDIDQIVWVVSYDNQTQTLVDQEIIDFFEFDQTLIELSDMDNIDYDKIINKVGVEAELNMILIKDSRVNIYEANCEDKICVNTGYISKPNQALTCIPHKFVVKIKGRSDVDA